MIYGRWGLEELILQHLDKLRAQDDTLMLT